MMADPCGGPAVTEATCLCIDVEQTQRFIAQHHATSTAPRTPPHTVSLVADCPAAPDTPTWPTHQLALYGDRIPVCPHEAARGAASGAARTRPGGVRRRLSRAEDQGGRGVGQGPVLWSVPERCVWLFVSEYRRMG